MTVGSGTDVLIGTRQMGGDDFGREILPCNGLPTTTPNKLLLIRYYMYSKLTFTGLYVQEAWHSPNSYISRLMGEL